MATLHERALDASDATLIARTQQALIKWVLYRLAGQNVTDAEKRLGKQVLANPQAFARMAAPAITQSDFWKVGGESDPSPDTAPGDAALSYMVEAQLWPIYILEVAP